MIYLIDDSDLKAYNAEFALGQDYSHVLTVVHNADKLKDIWDSLQKADCILVHRTFDGSNETSQRIAELTNDGDKIPYVVFSGGDNENAVFNGQVIDGLKKSVFYDRLKFFLDHFISNNEIDLRILAYGNNYKKNQIQKCALNILKIVSGKTGVVAATDLAQIASCPDFKELISESSPALGYSYDELLEYIEDNPTSFESFKSNINNIVTSFSQYGTNIYHWK